MSIKNRITKLEKQQPAGAQSSLFGTRPDGTRYPITTWRELMEADERGELLACPLWQEFIQENKNDVHK